MKNISCMILLLALSGCSATAEKAYTQSGKEGYAVDCSMNRLSWADCYKKAGEICGTNGYIVADKSTDQTGIKSTRSLLIQCK